MHCMPVYKPLVYRQYYFYDINSGNLISSASNTVALWMFTKSAFEITFCYFGKKKHIFDHIMLHGALTNLEGAPDHGREVGMRWSLLPLPTPNILQWFWVYRSLILDPALQNEQ